MFVLTAGTGYFVAQEMEQAVLAGQRGAKAALAGMRELSLMLAGAQLGISLCTLGS